ncbi:tRNA ligase 1-like isoform X2 [Zingiber officinale]|uniref:tRNA ligase 1-like isoform X2 n=1 Tax=Zingiber officinale TaxID=94328 RepID=UPI001C4C2D61|nr:tRNA ligase 1-like isoform X2 [Zingiber officinale]
MSASSQGRLLRLLAHNLNSPSACKLCPLSPSLLITLLRLRRLPSPPAPILAFPLHRSFAASSSSPTQMPRRTTRWKEKQRPVAAVTDATGSASPTSEDASLSIASGIGRLSLADNFEARSASRVLGSGASQMQNREPASSHPQVMWKPKSYVTVSTPLAAPDVVDVTSSVAASCKGTASIGNTLVKLFKGPLGADFNVDNNSFSLAQVRATFYPKFENEKSDQEIRMRMIEMVSHGQAILEVSLKHSGSLFMYAGHEGGAYAKNSFGNIYTAVGVFVLSRMFVEAWGKEAGKMQAQFNKFLEENRICISMELVTAVLGDHGQRPIDDYVVVTAVAELGHGKPKFYSTPDLIAFCRQWRLPTNHVWLFSTRKSATSFFAAFDALCEEGTATPVCKALDEVADISVPGSKDHIKVQGEILEGLVARMVSCDSSKHMEKVLKDFPPPSLDGVGLHMGPTLREVCAANRSDEKQQVRALLQSAGTSMCPDHADWFGIGDSGVHSRQADRSVLSKFLQAHPTDHATMKLQEMIRLIKQRHFPAAFKCYYNFHKIDSLASDNIHYKMVIHIHSDSVFRRYQQEMRRNRGLWPLYRGFFVDVNLFKVTKERAAELSKEGDSFLKSVNGNPNSSSLMAESLADEDANLMIKLKFLTYKLRTFLIRNGLSILFKDGPSAYKTYYLRQMKIWGTSVGKQQELSKMLDEWAVFIRRKYGNKQLSSSTYLSEAEPFLEQYARRSPQNQVLVGAAGNLIDTENLLAIIEAGRDEEGDLHKEVDETPSRPTASVMDSVPKDEGLIVFFPGIPGCAKSALCKEILNSPDALGDQRPVHSLMGDLIKGRYWQKVADERKKRPYAITLADKNAPNEEVWRQIEDMCRTTKASAIPVIPESEGTDSNPFSLDALAVFIFRVLQRVNHPGNLDKASPNAGYVLLMFYHLYDGKDHRDFESELYERFGSVVKMPLLKPDRKPLPDSVKDILNEGINLYRLHTNRHGRLEPAKGSYAKEWSRWEKRLREILFGNADHLNAIQVPFDFAVKRVLEQLKDVAKGGFKTPESEKRKFGNIVFAAVTLPVEEIKSALDKVACTDAKAKAFIEGKNLSNSLMKAHVTLAHKRSHGVTSVASYGVFLKQNVPVDFTALLFSDKLAALEVQLGSINSEKIDSKNEWPHATLWTAPGTPPKEANTLSHLAAEGKATRIDIKPQITVSGVLDFF